MNLLPPLAACLVTGLALPGLARHLGWIDAPGARRTHTRPTARVGGLAIAFGIAVGVLVSFAVHGGLDDTPVWVAWLVPAGAFLAIGLLDDRGRLRTRTKFTLQALAAALAVALGLRWDGAGLGPFPALGFGAAGPFMTWLWIVAVLTVINFLDGLDLITTTTCAVLLGIGVGAGAGAGEGMLYAVALGALLGFAPHNRAPARSFLGDGGTHLLGFLVATLALRLPGSTTAVAWPLASAALLPAVIDIGWGLVSKWHHGVPLARAHDQHPSQRLVHAGATHATVALRYGTLALLAALTVGWVGPRFGLAACLACAVPILAGHLLHVVLATRRVPVRFATEATPAVRSPR